LKPFFVATFIAFLLSCLLFTFAGPDSDMPWGVGISGVTGIVGGTGRGDMMMGNVILKDQPRNAAYLKELINGGTQSSAEFPLGAQQ
jgi:hypothetical protein